MIELKRLLESESLESTLMQNFEESCQSPSQILMESAYFNTLILRQSPESELLELTFIIDSYHL